MSRFWEGFEKRAAFYTTEGGKRYLHRSVMHPHNDDMIGVAKYDANTYKRGATPLSVGVVSKNKKRGLMDRFLGTNKHKITDLHPSHPTFKNVNWSDVKHPEDYT